MFLALISVVSLLIASVFAFFGAWPILPFAGLELIALFVAFRINRNAISIRETVEIDDHYVRVTVGCKSPGQVCVFKRAWTRVWVIPSQIKSHPSRLLLRSAGQQVEIGRCLSDEERHDLAKRLKSLIEREDSAGEGPVGV